MKQKTILFVEPVGAVANVFSKFMSIPLLGPMYLAAMAKAAGHNVSIFNENLMGRDVTSQELAEADLLCVSCITATIERGKRISAQYRDARAALGKPSRSVVGGIHASMLPDDVSAHFDQVVTGEAESIFLDIVEGTMRDPLVRGERLENLDSLPFPDYSLISGWGRRGLKPVMTSRGCPFDCNFCSVTKMFGRDYRAQSPSRVWSEISRHAKGTVFFVDDNFCADLDRSNEILDLMLANRFARKWTAQVRTNVTKSPEFVRKMRQAGCKVVYVGLESINPQALKDMHKSQTVEDIKRSIRVFRENNIMVHGMFILGSDADTMETFRTTAEFSKESGLDYVQYSVLTPLPGTEVFTKLDTDNRLLHKNWNYYDGLHVTFAPKQMTATELQRGMIECFSDFYTYANAFNSALNATVSGVAGAVQRLYRTAHIRSFYPSFVRLMGRSILKKWTKENRRYLAYLREAPRA
jgi:anaerobic magnesium-protoporphyrin IX monomethyl ester cyclase